MIMHAFKIFQVIEKVVSMEKVGVIATLYIVVYICPLLFCLKLKAVRFFYLGSCFAAILAAFNISSDSASQKILCTEVMVQSGHDEKTSESKFI